MVVVPAAKYGDLRGIPHQVDLQTSGRAHCKLDVGQDPMRCLAERAPTLNGGGVRVLKCQVASERWLLHSTP